MKIWFDTEFYEHQGQMDLISIGMVDENGRTLYLENANFHWMEVPEDHWIQANVRPHLQASGQWIIKDISVFKSRDEIALAILEFVGKETPEFWGYYADYDWVLLCWLFGSMIDLPKGWPMFCLDVQQWRYMKNPSLALPAHTGTAHNALDDALWTKEAWEYLKALS